MLDAALGNHNWQHWTNSKKSYKISFWDWKRAYSSVTGLKATARCYPCYSCKISTVQGCQILSASRDGILVSLKQVEIDLDPWEITNKSWAWQHIYTCEK